MAEQIKFKPSSYHLSADTGILYEPQRSTHFELVITGVENLLREGVDEVMAVPSDRIENVDEVLRIALDSCDIPGMTSSPINIDRGNSSMHAMGRPNWNTLNLQFNDYIGSDTVSAVRAWERLTYDVTDDTVGWMKDYKKECFLYQLDPDFMPVRYWDLKGCFITNVSEPSMQHGTNDGAPRKIRATLVYDKAIIHSANN